MIIKKELFRLIELVILAIFVLKINNLENLYDDSYLFILTLLVMNIEFLS
jgi:hypothetical protein